MEKMNDLKALLQHEVQDLMSVEDQIIEAMPLMIETAQNGDLKKALQQHLSVTEKQRTRLDEVQKLISGEQNGQAGEENKGFLSGLMNVFSGGEKCKGMEGIITEGQKIIKADMNADVKDAAIIACAQKIEHYEICGYGTTRAYASQLDMKQAEKLLQQTLDEEYVADDTLTKLALGNINEKAETAKASGKPAAKKAGNNGAAKNNLVPKKVAAKKSAAPKKTAEAEDNKKAPKKAASKTTNQQPKKAAAKSSNEKQTPDKKAAAKSAVPKRVAGKK